MKTSFLLVALCVVGVMLLVGCASTTNPAAAPLQTVAPQPNVLTSIHVKAPPHLDGSADDVAWQIAPGVVAQAEGEGVKPFPVTVKSVYDDQNIYMLVQYQDRSMEVDRSPWAYNADAKAWARLGDNLGDEDELGFYWNVNVPNYQDKGCQDLCHKEDPNKPMMYTPAGTWVDVWGWNGARTNAMGWARHMKLTDNPQASPDAPYGMVMQEGFATNTGFADNVQTLNGVELPLYWKPYSGAGGVVVGDRLFLLQSEIDSGDAKKIVGIAANGALQDEAGNTISVDTRIPGRILSAPAGPSWNEISAHGAWFNGVWSVEFARKLQTGRADDVQFDTAKTYYYDIYFKTRAAGEKDREIVTVHPLAFAK